MGTRHKRWSQGLYTGAGNRDQHKHAQGNTGSTDPGDTNNTDPGNTDATDPGDAQAKDPGDTNTTDPGDTNAENPPLLAVQYIIKT